MWAVFNYALRVDQHINSQSEALPSYAAGIQDYGNLELQVRLRLR
jgi:hypothetical protein